MVEVKFFALSAYACNRGGTLLMNISHQHDTRTHTERGFSLIDVAVVMAIVGVLLAGFLATYKMYQATRASTVTEENFMAAQEALGAFVANWNRYPAAFGLTTGDTKYGVAGDPAAAVNCLELPMQMEKSVKVMALPKVQRHTGPCWCPAFCRH